MKVLDAGPAEQAEEGAQYRPLAPIFDNRENILVIYTELDYFAPQFFGPSAVPVDDYILHSIY